MRRKIARLDADVQILVGLPTLFGDYAATAFEGADLAQGGDALKLKVREKFEQLSCRSLLEICSACHPFFTGKSKVMDTAGRIERFKRKYGQK